jgi:exopolyphosphatase/guanosine-5'-triphosphate,3'-diphosphate pyrophosphatase
MLCGCIDIGTNTTRVLVAHVASGALGPPVLEQRVFSGLGRSLRADGTIPGPVVDAAVAVVAAQRAAAEAAGAACLRVVATAAIRSAPNRDAFLAALRAGAGVEAVVLAGEDEARLAFLGATRTLPGTLPGRVAVVDVGGGSTEIALGVVADGADWSASFPVGSSRLLGGIPCADPPTRAQLAAMRSAAATAFGGLDVARPDAAVAVGGSAASLRKLVGDVLDEGALAGALTVLSAEPAAALGTRLGIDPERVRLLPAGILVLGAAAEALGRPLLIGRGGLREGILLELAARGPA